jgi:hypothetical protein
MTTPPKTRQVHRERTAPAPPLPRGAKQVVIPVTRPQYDDTWDHAEGVRALLAQWAEAAPELFPAGFDRGYSLHGFGRRSLNLPRIGSTASATMSIGSATS